MLASGSKKEHQWKDLSREVFIAFELAVRHGFEP